MGDGLKRAFAAAKATRTETPDVHAGQVWADNDERSMGRTLRVDRVDGDKVICTVLTNSNPVQAELDRGDKGVRDTRGKTTRISVSRFRPTAAGYRLIDPADDGGCG